MHRNAPRVLLAALLISAAMTFGVARAAQNPPPRTATEANHLTKQQILKARQQARAKALAKRRFQLRRYARMMVSNRRTAWYWQQQSLQRPSPTNYPERWSRSPLYMRQMYLLWKNRVRDAWYRANHPPSKYDWLCIHRYEGSWRDSGDPYWGGLQMDRGFMKHYAPAWLLKRGYADNWTPLQQMWVAERAKASGRGFHPWPNTAHYCGLI